MIASCSGAHLSQVVITGGGDDKLEQARGVCLGTGKVVGSYNYRGSQGPTLSKVARAAAPEGIQVIYDTVG